MEKIFKIFTIINLIFCVWIIASVADVVVDNHAPNPQHSDKNFFVVMTEVADNYYCQIEG